MTFNVTETKDKFELNEVVTCYFPEFKACNMTPLRTVGRNGNLQQYSHLYTMVSLLCRPSYDLWEVMEYILSAAKTVIKESLTITSNVQIHREEYTTLLAASILYLDINIFLLGCDIKLKQRKLKSRSFMIVTLFTQKLLCK